MRTRRLMAIAFGAIALGLLAGRAMVSRHPTGPPEVSLWYWHSPFHLGREETRNLSILGVKQLFVRAGTISASGEGVELILPQNWQSSPGSPEAHLVFALDAGVARHFEDLSNRRIAECVVSSFFRQRGAAKRAGVRVRGVQIDFDCATRLLPKYANLLLRIRHELPEGIDLSITSLPTWFTSKDMPALIRQVDFYCPQFYETRIGRTLRETRPVSDLRVLRNGLEAAGRLGKPFYAGIPAYGHAFMFDDRGRLLGTYRGMSATDAARHPSFRLTKAWPSDSSGKPATCRAGWIGEDFADFLAIRPGAGGKGLGYHLIYTLPTARMLSLQMKTVRERRPGNCRGAIIFRCPEENEIMTLPSTCLSAAVAGREPRLSVRATVKAERAHWDLVEGGSSSSTVTVSLTNTGEAGSFLSSDAVTVALHFDAPGLETEPGDFDRVERFSDSGLPASEMRTANLVCKRSHLSAGETVTLGPIRVIGSAGAVRGEWRVRRPGGFGLVAGKIDVVQLHEGVRRP